MLSYLLLTASMGSLIHAVAKLYHLPIHTPAKPTCCALPINMTLVRSHITKCAGLLPKTKAEGKQMFFSMLGPLDISHTYSESSLSGACRSQDFLGFFFFSEVFFIVFKAVYATHVMENAFKMPS